MWAGAGDMCVACAPIAGMRGGVPVRTLAEAKAHAAPVLARLEQRKLVLEVHPIHAVPARPPNFVPAVAHLHVSRSALHFLPVRGIGI